MLTVHYHITYDNTLFFEKKYRYPVIMKILRGAIIGLIQFGFIVLIVQGKFIQSGKITQH